MNMDIWVVMCNQWYIDYRQYDVTAWNQIKPVHVDMYDVQFKKLKVENKT